MDTNTTTDDVGISSERQVGMKSKCEDNDEEDDVEWEEATSAGDSYYLLALNLWGLFN